MEGYKTVWHWAPENKPAGYARCWTRADERLTRPGGCLSSLHMVEHRTTRNRMAVNCQVCQLYMPEVIALREQYQVRGTEVVTALAQLGISASYENRDYPKVEFHLAEAEKLLEALDAAFQNGVHAGQESAA